MGRNIINIRSDEYIKLSNKLQRIGKADLPVAVRSTLNEMAFRMKGTGGTRGEIDKRAEQEFDYRRNRTLFKAVTGVSKASGLNISGMQSESGIIKRSGLSEVAEGLADQQRGGKTEQKATPLTKSRTGRNIGKRVRKPSYLQSLQPYDMRGKQGRRWIAAAIRAKKSRRAILIESRNGTKLIARVRNFKRKPERVEFKIDWLYRINDNGMVTLKRKRPFVNRAAQIVIKDMPNEFKRQATKRIEKSLRR